MHKLYKGLSFWVLTVVVCAVVLFPRQAWAQKQTAPDTAQLLKQLANHPKNDTGKVVLQCKFAMAKWYASAYDIRVFEEITVYKMQALALSIQLNWYKGIDMSRKILNGTFAMGGNQASKEELLAQIVNYTKALTDDDLKNKCSLDISEIYLAMDNLKEARNYYNKGLNYFVEHKNAAELLLYLRIEDSRKLIDDEKFNTMALRVIDIARAANDDKTLAACYDLLAYKQQMAQHSDEALKYYQLEATLFAKAGNYAGLSLSLRKIGGIYEARSNRDVALTYFLKAADAAEKRITAKNWDYLEEYYVVIAGCYEGMHNYRDAEKYLRIAIARSSLPKETAEAWRSLSGYYLDRADYVKSIEADEKAREYFAKGGDQQGVAVSYKEIGDIFALTGNIDGALVNYQKGFDVYMGLHNSAWPPTILTSMGLLYLREQPEKAMQYFNRATALSKSFHNHIFDPQTNAAISTAFFNEKNYGSAFAYAQFSLNDTASSNYFDADARAALYRVIGKVVRDAPDTLLVNHGIKPADRYKTAMAYLNKSKSLMDSAIGETEALRDEAEDFYITYEKQKDYPGAYAAYRQYISLRDSIANRQQVSAFEQREENLVFNKKADSLRSVQHLTQSELEKQQLALRLNNQELDLANKDKAIQHAGFLQTQTNLKAEQSRRKANEAQLKATRADDALQKTEINNKRVQSYYLYGGIAALLFVSFFIARNYFNQKRSNVLLSNANNQIVKEKQRSDDLLLNILPADVAEELKEKGSSDARLFDEVTVLFTDFVSFTTVSELLSPQELVNELNVCFKAFDGIMTTHHIEKIKTVGDAYLAVSGLPNADKNHAANVINAAQEIQRFMLDRKLTMGDKTFGIRLGVHSGSVVAGIVGVKKFAYDIWGDTVNTAARMEQNSEPGKINVSEKTYELVKHQFAFTYRGEIAAKNKGMMKMYFAELIAVLLLWLIPQISSAQLDTNKVKSFAATGKKYEGSDNAKAYNYFVQSLQLAERAQWPKGIIRGYLNLGDFVYNPRYNHTANAVHQQLTAYRTAYTNAGKYQLSDLKYEALSDMAEVNSLLKQYVVAAAEYSESLKYFEKSNDEDALYTALDGIQKAYDKQGTDTAGLFVKKTLKKYLDENKKNTARVAFLELTFYFQDRLDYDSALIYALGSLKYFNYRIKTHPDYFEMLNVIGRLYRLKHDYANALVYYLKAVSAIPQTDKARHALEIEEANSEIGNCYFAVADYATALSYHLKAGTVFYFNKVSLEVIDDYIALENYDQANAHLKSLLDGYAIRKMTYDTKNIAALYAQIYYLKKDYVHALQYARQGLAMPAYSGYELKYDDANEAALSIVLGNSYVQALGRYREAVKYLMTAIELSKKNGFYGKERDAYSGLSLAYQKAGDYENAYRAYHDYIDLKDSILDQGKQKIFRVKEAGFAALKQQDSLRYQRQLTTTIVKAQKVQRYYFISGIALLLGISFFITRNYINQRKSNKVISFEKQRSDDLLLNILPADVAEELKEKGSADARLFDEVTVLFTDFVNFTTVSQSLSPQQLVDELNVCFKAFDGVMTTHNIEKIKTVGDAYLAVSGLPNADKNHAANVINAAKDIQQFMLERKLKMGNKTFGIRLGVHSGSVVAGIVGVKKFAYDIWGDTVNTAARMEQNSEPGKINVSEKTYELVKNQFAFIYRGEIEAKNKGMMKMYFVEN